MNSRVSIPKQYQPLAGEPLIAHSLRCFINHPAITYTVLVIHPDDEPLARSIVATFDAPIRIVYGGKTRQISAYRGLKALLDINPNYVHIHDGARPLINSELLDILHQACQDPQKNKAGFIPTIAVCDTIKQLNSNGLVIQTIPRANLHAAQTPQYFPFSLILDAHIQAARNPQREFTDDASLAEWAGLPVYSIAGQSDNKKITYPHDLTYADAQIHKNAFIFPDIRTGNGYDVHGFEAGDCVTLCGISIPHSHKLSGHSDADVGLHALTDALLATCGAGDIGHHFPPSDPQWRGVASYRFVEHARHLIKQAEGRIANVDITLILEAPKIAPHRVAMVKRVADILHIEPARVSIKATTNEGLGFIGRKEGIAAIATANVIFPHEVPDND